MTAMTSLHLICEKIDEVEEMLVKKKFGPYSMKELLGKEKKEEEEKKAPERGTDSSGL